jgi:hypothetical protein
MSQLWKLGGIATLAFLSVAPTAAPSPGSLTATVNRVTTSLTNNSGLRVTRLPAGRYAISVQDDSRQCNFRLKGPGIDRATSIGARDHQTWLVTFKRGTYRYSCDRRPSAAATIRIP